MERARPLAGHESWGHSAGAQWKRIDEQPQESARLHSRGPFHNAPGRQEVETHNQPAGHRHQLWCSGLSPSIRRPAHKRLGHVIFQFVASRPSPICACVKLANFAPSPRSRLVAGLISGHYSACPSRSRNGSQASEAPQASAKFKFACHHSCKPRLHANERSLAGGHRMRRAYFRASIRIVAGSKSGAALETMQVDDELSSAVLHGLNLRAPPNSGLNFVLVDCARASTGARAGKFVADCKGRGAQQLVNTFRMSHLQSPLA